MSWSRTTASLALLAWSSLASAADHTVPIAQTQGPIAIDGSLEESSWATAVPVTEFLQYRPNPGGPAPGTTEIRFLQDDKTLYVGVKVTEADYEIRARVSPREAINEDDQIGLYLDTFGDGRQGYIFYFNPCSLF